MSSELLKLSLQWISNHKCRYIFAWLSFGFITVLLAFGFSFGESMLDDLKNDNQCCVSVKGDENALEDLKKETAKVNAIGYRAVSDTGMEIETIDDRMITDYLGEIDYFDSDGEMLISKSKEAYWGLEKAQLSEDDIFISKQLLKELKIAKDDILGKKVKLANQNKEYVIKGVFYEKYDLTNEVIAYIPNEKMLTDIPKFGIKRIDFIFKDINSANNANHILGKKYELIGDAEKIEYKEQLSRAFKKLTLLISGFLFSIAGIGLINISLVILNENKNFLFMLKVLGMNSWQYKFLICNLTVIQGWIGTVIGLGMTVLLQKFFPTILKFLMGEFYKDLNMNFRISMLSIFIICSFNFWMSILVGAIITGLKGKKYNDGGIV